MTKVKCIFGMMMMDEKGQMNLEKMIGMDEGKINFGNNDDRQYRQSNSWE
jgi:hypothetical protein